MLFQKYNYELPIALNRIVLDGNELKASEQGKKRGDIKDDQKAHTQKDMR